MSTDDITIAGIQFSHAAAEALMERGDPTELVRADLETLRGDIREYGPAVAFSRLHGVLTRGADEDRMAGWDDYIEALAASLEPA